MIDEKIKRMVLCKILHTPYFFLPFVILIVTFVTE